MLRRCKLAWKLRNVQMISMCRLCVIVLCNKRTVFTSNLSSLGCSHVRFLLNKVVVFFKWRSAWAHQIHFLGQDQSTEAQWAEMTVADCSLFSCMWAHFPIGSNITRDRVLWYPRPGRKTPGHEVVGSSLLVLIALLAVPPGGCYDDDDISERALQLTNVTAPLLEL